MARRARRSIFGGCCPGSASINRAPCGDRPQLLDAARADADVPVVEVDGGVAVAGDQADLVAEREAGLVAAETARRPCSSEARS
jgi:hypothetical protein